MRCARLIVNPAAGGGRAGRMLGEVERALTARGVEHTTELTRSLDHARAIAHVAATNKEVAVALGGDGLAGAVAGALAERPGSVLGIVPGGRGNDLARVLGIPSDAWGAAGIVAAGVERDLDLGSVDGRLFVGIASCGFDSDANRIANDAPARLGNLVYAYGAIRALISWRPARFRVDVDGDIHEFRGYSFAAANSKAYGGGMYLAPAAELDDGLLDVVITSETSKLRFLASLPKVFKGTHVEEASVVVVRGREVRVSADRAFDVYADGDPIGELPVVVRAVRHAVRVLVAA